jgi:hypothetical protein
MTKNIIISYNEADESFLMALFKKLQISVYPTKPKLEDLENRLLPQQRQVWENLKTAIQEANEGEAAAYSLEDLLTEYEHENTTHQTVC